MKLFVILTAMMIGFSGAARANDDAGSEATVASPAFDPTKEDCKCLQPKKVDLPLDNEANDRQVVNWISDPSVQGGPPTLGNAESTR